MPGRGINNNCRGATDTQTGSFCREKDTLAPESDRRVDSTTTLERMWADQGRREACVHCWSSPTPSQRWLGRKQGLCLSAGRSATKKLHPRERLQMGQQINRSTAHASGPLLLGMPHFWSDGGCALMCSLTQMSGSPASCCTHSARLWEPALCKKKKKKKLELLTPFLCRVFSQHAARLRSAITPTAFSLSAAWWVTCSQSSWFFRQNQEKMHGGRELWKYHRAFISERTIKGRRTLKKYINTLESLQGKIVAFILTFIEAASGFYASIYLCFDGPMTKLTSSSADRIIKTRACCSSHSKALSRLHINKTAHISLAFVTIWGLQEKMRATRQYCKRFFIF